MKKHYCKPVIVIEEFVTENMLATSDTNEDYIPIVPDPGTPAVNEHRGSWGNLWE